MGLGKYGVDSIVKGRRKGEPANIRGDFTRFTIWNALLESDTPMQTTDIMQKTNCSYEQVKAWLDTWCKYGYVQRATVSKPSTGGKLYEHTIIKEAYHPPQIDLKGRPKAIEHRQYAWEAARALGMNGDTFMVGDVVAYVKARHGIEISYDYLIGYLRDLYNARYLWSLPNYTRDPIYTMKFDTGSLAPSMCRGKRIFDANLGVIVN